MFRLIHPGAENDSIKPGTCRFRGRDGFSEDRAAVGKIALNPFKRVAQDSSNSFSFPMMVTPCPRRHRKYAAASPVVFLPSTAILRPLGTARGGVASGSQEAAWRSRRAMGIGPAV